MENSAIEALLTGVNVLIFVVALTVAITLMVGVVNLSNTASDIAKNTNTNALKEIRDGVEPERIINGKELLKYNTKSSGNSGTNDLSKYTIMVEDPPRTPDNLADYCSSTLTKTILSSNYTMQVEGMIINFKRK